MAQTPTKAEEVAQDMTVVHSNPEDCIGEFGYKDCAVATSFGSSSTGSLLKDELVQGRLLQGRHSSSEPTRTLKAIRDGMDSETIQDPTEHACIGAREVVGEPTVTKEAAGKLWRQREGGATQTPPRGHPLACADHRFRSRDEQQRDDHGVNRGSGPAPEDGRWRGRRARGRARTPRRGIGDRRRVAEQSERGLPWPADFGGHRAVAGAAGRSRRLLESTGAVDAQEDNDDHIHSRAPRRQYRERPPRARRGHPRGAVREGNKAQRYSKSLTS